MCWRSWSSADCAVWRSCWAAASCCSALSEAIPGFLKVLRGGFGGLEFGVQLDAEHGQQDHHALSGLQVACQRAVVAEGSAELVTGLGRQLLKRGFALLGRGRGYVQAGQSPGRGLVGGLPQAAGPQQVVLHRVGWHRCLDQCLDEVPGHSPAVETVGERGARHQHRPRQVAQCLAVGVEHVLA